MPLDSKIHNFWENSVELQELEYYGSLELFFFCSVNFAINSPLNKPQFLVHQFLRGILQLVVYKPFTYWLILQNIFHFHFNMWG